MSRQIRVATVWINLGPYHITRLAALAGRSGFIVTGIQLAGRETAREWTVPVKDPGFACETVVANNYERADHGIVAAGLLKLLDRLQPDAVVVAGYSEHPMRVAANWAKANRRASILMSDSQKIDRPRSWPRELLKRRWIRRNIDAGFVSGQHSARYLEDLGLPAASIWRGYDVVDNAHFEATADHVRAEETAWRQKLGLPAEYFLYVGRFAPEKNLVRLLEAYRQYRLRARTPWDLVLVGSGPLEAELRGLVTEKAIGGVHWPGFKQIDELPTYYGLAACFVLPSIREPWGLVVNEAMAAGLPVLVSNTCGAAGDLVFPGINGYVFDPKDVGSLADLMHRMAAEGTAVHQMAKASRRIIGLWTPETWANALADCLAATVNQVRDGA
jgi:1,2-diacylglycerol 3-alpha-glucosyltransferase